MRKLIVALAALLLAAPHAVAANTYNATVAVTSTSQSVALGGKAIELQVLNDGLSPIFVDIDNGTASSSSSASTKILPCEGLLYHFKGGQGPSDISLATATSTTATARVTAFFIEGAEKGSGLVTPIRGAACPTAYAAIATTSNGAAVTFYADTELMTLDTTPLATETDSTADLLRAGAIIDSVVCRVTTTITTATEWSVGDNSGSASERFIAQLSNLTAGTVQVGLEQWQSANVALQPAAGKLRITTTGTPGAGAIRCTVFQRVYTAPTS